MTETEIETLLRRLTPAQRRYLAATISDEWQGVGRGVWQTLDALLAKKLLIGVWVRRGDRDVLRYGMPALIAQVFTRLEREQAAP